MGELALAIAANVALGVVLLALLMRPRRAEEAGLGGADEAIARYRTQYPDADGAVTLAADGNGALVDLRDGAVGWLERRGRRWNARRVVAGDVADVALHGDDAIAVRFADFAWPRSRIRVADPQLRALWRSRLAALQRGAAQRSPTEPRHA